MEALEYKHCLHCIYNDEGWCDQLNGEPDLKTGKVCRKYKKPTNGDRIRKMYNQELSEFMLECAKDFDPDTVCPLDSREMDDEEMIKLCKQCLLSWLNKEVDDGGKNDPQKDGSA